MVSRSRQRSTSVGLLQVDPMGGPAVAVASIDVTFRSGGEKSGERPAPARPQRPAAAQKTVHVDLI